MMNDLPSPDVFALQRSGLNDFLFAVVGAEANGMTLSVVSVFARLGNDPWQEASRLAMLPRSEATESLARSIAGMPTSIWPIEAATTIAEGLISLLPMHVRPSELAPPASEQLGKSHHLLKIAVMLVCIACVLAFEAGCFPTFEAPEPNFSSVAGWPCVPLAFGTRQRSPECRGLAATAGPWTIRGDIPWEWRQCWDSSWSDGGRPQGARHPLSGPSSPALLQAIAELRADAKTASDRISYLSQANASLSGSTAERRQLNVMFGDVIDFTALSSRIDPEDLSAVIRGYQSLVATTIARFGGFAARYVGDGILFCFGWPEAHEANAESAVRAALVLEDAEHSDRSAATLEVPVTLQASLTARLDRLPVAKRVAQIGAVIGRDFAHTWLVTAAQLPEVQLAHGIGILVASGLAFRHGIRPDAVHTLKHALVHDAAYHTLLRSQRQELHARIAKALEEGFPETINTQPEFLAHHFIHAVFTDRAIDCLRRAGLRAALS